VNLLSKRVLATALLRADDARDDKAGPDSPPSSGSAPAREVLFNMAHARSSFHRCCNDADCYPTEIKYDGNIYAKRRGTESTFPFQRKGSSGTGTIPMAALVRSAARWFRGRWCSASHWEAPMDSSVNGRTPRPRSRVKCEQPLRALSARNQHAPRLLRSRLLRGSLRKCRPFSKAARS
jgi:hypothetical protein